MVEQTEHVENIPKSEQPFAKCAFRDERLRLARMFTNYFNRTKSDSGYVANLNGEWGTGKTFFVTEWSRLLKAENYGVVFIDAWKSDYLDGPLSIVASEMLQQLTEQLKNEFSVHYCEEIKKGIWRKSAGLTKAFLPAVAQAVSKNFFGDDTVELIKDLITGAIEYSEQDIPKSLSDKLGEFGEHAFATHQRHREFANDFKSELQKLIDLTSEKSGKEKVYIFIDELDRCRPTYAIEMLETIKHLFDIKNLVFIISTDTAQLEHSIKAVYGNGFDSFEYLHRFFKQRVTLPKPDYYKFLCMNKAFDGIGFKAHYYYPKIDSADKLRALAALQAETNQVELRKLENICSQIDAFLTNIDLEKKTAIDVTFLVSAIFTVNLSPVQTSDYTRSIRESGSDERFIVHTTRISDPENNDAISSYNKIVRFFIDEFNRLSNHQKQTFNPNNLGFLNPSNAAAKILLSDIANGYYLTYINNLTDDFNHKKASLLTHDQLIAMIQQLKISDVFNQ